MEALKFLDIYAHLGSIWPTKIIRSIQVRPPTLTWNRECVCYHLSLKAHVDKILKKKKNYLRYSGQSVNGPKALRGLFLVGPIHGKYKPFKIKMKTLFPSPNSNRPSTNFIPLGIGACLVFTRANQESKTNLLLSEPSLIRSGPVLQHAGSCVHLCTPFAGLRPIILLVLWMTT